MTKLEQLLRDTAAREDNQVAATENPGQSRDEFIAGAAELVQSSSTRKKNRAPISAAIALAAAAGLAFLVYGIYPTHPAEDSRWVNVNHSHPKDMAFADGSTVRFDQGSRARVTNISDDSKEVVLEAGSATLHVIHRSKTNWKVLAGPFVVQVTGTRFTVTWDAEMEYFELNLLEGEVVVTGPMMEQGQTLAGERTLRVSLMEERMSVTRLNETDSDPTPGESARTPRKHRRRAANATSSSSTPSAAELLSHANSARRSGDVLTAERTYVELRKNHPGTVHASTAALYLGRMAFDQQRAYGKAVRWLQTYLNEQKSGSLRREALGLLMQAQQNANKPDGAKQSARRYLELYPAGPHAARAAEIARE